MTCVECGEPLAVPARGRRPRYCSRSCQAKAYRARVAAGATVTRAAPADPERSLTVAAIVQAAIDVADAEGAGALSMRRIAAELGAGTMSLYRYVADKEELLLHMVEEVIARGSARTPELTGWRERMTAVARNDWALYQRYPWVLPFVTSPRTVLLQNMSSEVEWALASFDGYDLTPVEKFQLVMTVTNYTSGVGLLMANDLEARRASGVELADWWESTGRDISRDVVADATHPQLSALMATQPGVADFGQAFEFGLARVLDGIAVLIEGRRPLPA
ncbi:TetR/AcrR family transcriptional regulator [Amycolatopsis sp. 195334CR]|uniref:TetR/AcrR family transcriptional regulator n=1 Tax=Amycolatopsis sp. 195334CR TaxID=2814588 RepID=UPI001A8D2E48|nr:TetR/AcrR family transcriptional regulator [Amycolatopsis sp. 195334CR]MBN6034999.1 TetR/AcrR family transcriptional regulator C-terminal domain-containing protein [Amycolatopsis sp. 195334CR]